MKFEMGAQFASKFVIVDCFAEGRGGVVDPTWDTETVNNASRASLMLQFEFFIVFPGSGQMSLSTVWQCQLESVSQVLAING